MTNQNPPAFRCHKEVRAFEIGKIEGLKIFPLDEFLCGPVEVSEAYIAQHPLNLPGFLVIYEDGYISYSPKDVFVKGYSLKSDIDNAEARVLMSRGNPSGYKLEVLLDVVISDIKIKTDFIKDKDGLTERTIIQQNQIVIGHLMAAAATQRLTYVRLDADKGEDKGVRSPRI